MRGRIASPELLPKIGLLPHLICSRINNFGSCDEEGELAELDLCCAGGGELGEQPVLVVGLMRRRLSRRILPSIRGHAGRISDLGQKGRYRESDAENTTNPKQAKKHA